MQQYFMDSGCLDESKALAGGRYGAAHFLQACGPKILHHLSLGRLSSMVQLAINQDFLRYQRTLLVWNPQGRNQPTSDLSQLRAAHRLILQVLKES